MHIYRAIILIALLTFCVPRAAKVLAQSSDLLVDTPTVAIMLAPGEQRTLNVRLTNPAPTSVQPLVYEAQAALPALTQLGKALALRTTIPQHTARLDPEIARMVESAPDQRADLLVFLADQADLSAALQIHDWNQRGMFVYQTLTAHAERTQANLRAALKAQGVAFRPLWIVNAIRVRGTLANAQMLAARNEVALVQADQHWQGAVPLATSNAQCSPDDPTNPICWNIRAIGANRVWDEFGVQGRGVTLATIDTGVGATHPALTRGYRGYLGPGLFTHTYNWYDPQGQTVGPSDLQGHGTHVMGIMVGQADPAQGLPAIGVAPGASWIAARACGTDCAESNLIAAAEWMIAPTDAQGRNPRPDLRPMIINNSWAGTGGDPWYAGYITAWRAAGMFPVFAAGNASIQQPASCGSIASPGDDFQAVAVGAIDVDQQITSFSLRGPSVLGVVKPDLSAPGTYRTGQIGIYSATIGGANDAYQGLQGTSMAAPHVAGAVALLWSANPALIGDYAATYAALTATARPRPDVGCGEQQPVPNNTYGYGALDAFAAVARVRVDLPWLSVHSPAEIAAGGAADVVLQLDAQRLPGPGVYQGRVQIYPGDLTRAPTTISLTVALPENGTSRVVHGTITAADTGLPLAAQIEIAAGMGVLSDLQGQYALRLFPGTYTLKVSVRGYFATQVPVVVGSTTVNIDIVLQPDRPRVSVQLENDHAAPQLALPESRTLLIKNTGTRMLTYQSIVLPEIFGVWRSDEPGGPAAGLITLPADAHELTIPASGVVPMPIPFDFRFYGKSFRTLYVGANGVIAFSAPIDNDQPTTRCQPDQQIYLFAVAPFWADIDLSRGGRVRTAEVPNGSVVVSYEQVLLRNPASVSTYSFQVELHADGRITFRYGSLGTLPDHLAVGVQRVPGDTLTLGCGTDTPLRSGMALELRPQPAAPSWLIGGNQTGSIAAGGELNIPLQIGWYIPSEWPYRGRIRILSSDYTHPITDVTITSTPVQAPSTVMLPVVQRR